MLFFHMGFGISSSSHAVMLVVSCREFGLMSTTTNKAVAVKYSKDWDKERNLSYVMEYEQDGLNRGAM